MSGGEGDGGVLSHCAPHLDLTAAVGGPARRTVVVLLAAVLGLQAADTGAVGALAAPLEKAFSVGNTQIGILVAATTLLGAAATVPFGSLTDRYDRSRMLQVVVTLWAVATVVGALSVNYTMLLCSRLALGGVVAVAPPAVASLVGDLFPAAERGRLYGYVLTGELIGAGFGILAAGVLSGLCGWRVALGILAVPAAVLARALRRHLPEPARGGQAHLAVGDTTILTAGDVEAGANGGAGAGPHEEPSVVGCQAADSGARPVPGTVVHHQQMGYVEVTRYILRVRTNDALIVASGLGYFFFGGLETFAELWFRERYGVGQTVASMLFVAVAAGALVGVLMSGRTADRRIAGGHTAARLTVGAVAYILTAVIFIPGALSASLVVSLPVFFVAAAALGATNPPVDAARLDVMPSYLWGRAEGLRTALRQVLQGLAPVVFGYVSAAFGASSSGIAAGVNTGKGAVGTAADGRALAYSFVVLSLPLVVAGVILLAGRGRYLRDAVAAMRSTPGADRRR